MTKLKFINLRTISLFMLVLIMTACGQTTKTETPADQTAAKDTLGYSGTYKTNDAACPMDITISFVNNAYHYKIKTSKKEQEGQLDVTKSGEEVYFDFVGLHGSDPKSNISGQFMDNKIVIQNDGNAMNAYTNFSECDMKYIELSK